MSVNFKWSVPPAQIAVNIEKYGERARIALKALADFIAQKMQDDLRQSAPWTDRTGAARRGLFSVAEQTSKELVTIWLSHGHTVKYGVWLEVRWGGRYAVIEPTIQKWLPEINRLLKELFR